MKIHSVPVSSHFYTVLSYLVYGLSEPESRDAVSKMKVVSGLREGT